MKTVNYMHTDAKSNGFPVVITYTQPLWLKNIKWMAMASMVIDIAVTG